MMVQPSDGDSVGEATARYSPRPSWPQATYSDSLADVPPMCVGEAAPPSAYCPQCAQPSGAFTAAVAAAAARAVEEAFEKLRPSLAQAVLRAASLQEGPGKSAPEGKRDSRMSGRRPSLPPSLFGAPPDAERRRRPSLPAVAFADVEPLRRRRPSLGLEAGRRRRPSLAGTEVASQHTNTSFGEIVPEGVSRQPSSTNSALWPHSATVSLQGRSTHSRPTVQTLQADVATALLRTSGYQAGGHLWGLSASSHVLSEPKTPAEPAPRILARSASTPAPARRADDGDSDGSGARAGDDRAGATASQASRSWHMLGNRVLDHRIDELAREASHGTLPKPPVKSIWASCMAAPAPIALRVVGVLGLDAERHPRVSLAYQGLVRLVMVFAAASFFLPLALHAVGDPSASWRQTTGILSQVPLPAGVALVLVPFGFRGRQSELEETFWLVRSVSVERGYWAWEIRRHRLDAIVFLLIWLCMLPAGWLSETLRQDSTRTSEIAHRTCLIAAFGGVILCLAYGTVRVCRSLIVMVDAFCCEVVSGQQVQHVSHVWNLTQAVIRKASAAVETCLLVLFLILALSVPLPVVDFAVVGASTEDVWALIPGLFVTCGIFYALLLAAGVSEKCARVPALVNAVSFGPGTERARQDAVDYITSSAAGFYVFGTRLTTAMVVKIIYVWCIIDIGFLTRLASSRL